MTHITIYWICNPGKYQKSIEDHVKRSQDGRYKNPERDKESKRKGDENKRVVAARFNLST